MQTTSRRPLVLGLAFIALLVAAVAAQAQNVVLLQMTNTNWRYYHAGNEPANQGAVTWRTNNYNDTSWSSGPGVFGVDNDAPFAPGVVIRTPLPLSNGTAPQTITYYFRTTFNYNQDPVGSELIFTNVIDDGAVVYLNGRELYRLRMAGTAQPAYTTLAQGGNPEGQMEMNTIISSPLLRQGANTIAVEVHQQSTTSSDIVFGMGLLARRAEPIVITDHPDSDVVPVGNAFNLSVEVTGSSPVYQWFKNGIAIAGANSASYGRPSASLADSGNYWVVVSNSFSRATSVVANITVVPDTFSPLPLTAIVEEHETNRVIVTFDDSLTVTYAASNPNFFRAATNVLNYRVHMVGQTAPIPIANAAGSGRQVRLEIEPNWDRTKEYYITFYNIADNELNPIRRGEQIGVKFRVNTTILDEHAEWRWTGQFLSNMPPSWTSLNYPEHQDEGWVSSGGPLYFEPDGNDATCMGPIYNGVGNGTTIAQFYNSYYFRRKFIIPTNYNLAETTLRLTHILDDGAVFYLNGEEIFRANLPAGELAYNTVALASWEVGTQNCRSNNFPASPLRHGTNILAVQLHQGPNPDAEAYDICMGMRIEVSTTVGFDIPSLTATRLPPLAAGQLPRVRLTWPGTAWTLQQSTNPSNTNSWSNVTGASGNGHTNTMSGTTLYYRLRK